MAIEFNSGKVTDDFAGTISVEQEVEPHSAIPRLAGRQWETECR